VRVDHSGLPSEPALSADGSRFFLERTVDQSHQTYAQVIRADGGGWLLERRDGSTDKHFRVVLPDLRTAHHALTAWAFELPDWWNAAAWEHTTP
jgi:hypothetical protein